MSVGVVGPVGRSRFALSVEVFGILVALCDATVVIFTGIATASFYHLAVYGRVSDFSAHFHHAVLVAFVYAVLRAADGAYRVRDARSQRMAIVRVLPAWNIAFIIALLSAFAAKDIAGISRGALFLSYFTGLAGLVVVQSIVYRILQRADSFGWLSRRPVLVVGTRPKLREINNRLVDTAPYRHVCAVFEVPSTDESDAADRLELATQLKRAVESARALNVEAILLLIPWSDSELIEQCADAFMNVPATVHLGPERMLERFSDLQVSNEGAIPTLSLVHAPMQGIDTCMKRAFDVFAATLGLVLLAPLLALVAIAIKLESPGPVLFRQRRHGFNQNTFPIIKFRTMHSQDDGDVIMQATANDPRVTRVGRWLRRTSIDELPQLLNVLKGDMSIVGPRPHALAHNREYEEKIALYARRHNVKPGITGWAQIHGLRGRTETVEHMRRRTDRDLYYIDNWSLSFDIFIIVCTMFSPSVFLNAH